MAKSTKDSPNKVSLEELLQFKRSERPDESFWNQFDQELHQRMMQTLVKKDPWLVQVMRGLTGKIAQTTAIAAAAALLALMVIRPAFVATGEHQPARGGILGGVVSASVETPKTVEVASNSLLDSSLIAEADYETSSLTSSLADTDTSVTQEFGLDHIDVASYHSSAYSADMAVSGFTSTGVASLVY